MPCRSGCPTQDHASWGECARSAGLRVGYCRSAAGSDATREKRWDQELESYRAARAQGIQPAGTTTEQIRRAVEISDATGRAFDAHDPVASVMG